MAARWGDSDITYKQTNRQTDYYNPLAAARPQVNEKEMWSLTRQKRLLIGGWKLGLTGHLLNRYHQLMLSLELYPTPLLNMPPDYLAYWMGKFVLKVRKVNGSEYPPKSLYTMVCCLTKMSAMMLIHYVLLMKDLEIFEPLSMQKCSSLKNFINIKLSEWLTRGRAAASGL